MPANGGGNLTADNRLRLLIVGASTRAAAWSAWCAGWRPVCADQFADVDLRQIADVADVSDYPHSLPADLANVSGDGWLFVGAMENHLRVLRRMLTNSRFGRYFGPSPETIQLLRDPLWLAERWKTFGCYPAVQMTAGELPGNPSVDRWLRKPMKSAGGRGIRFVTDPVAESTTAEPSYWQQFIQGEPFSALFLVTPGQRRLLMASRQLIGWPGSAPPSSWSYCGSIGPWPIAGELSGQLDRMIEAVTFGLDYRGLIGIDFVWDGRRAWAVEINPRDTASAELWELATRRSVLGEHLACFEEPPLSPRQTAPSIASAPLLAKAILYADRPVIAPNLNRFLTRRSSWAIPFLADIPVQGSAIPTGWPICTVFASGTSVLECERKLANRIRRVRGWFTVKEPRTE